MAEPTAMPPHAKVQKPSAKNKKKIADASVILPNQQVMDVMVCPERLDKVDEAKQSIQVGETLPTHLL